MKERLVTATALLASAGALVGCNNEQPIPNPEETNHELIIAHETTFGESKDSNVEHFPIKIGTKVLGICMLYTREEVAQELNTGFMIVEWNNKTGSVRTSVKNASGEFVDTFKDMSETDLLKIYPRCPQSPE